MRRSGQLGSSVESPPWAPGGASTGNTRLREVQMSTESVKALVRQVVDDWNKADLDALDEHLDPATYVNRDPNNPEVTDFAGYKRWAAAARAAFPDLHVTIDDLIAEG